ncbi:MAG: lytic transglycosylase [Desulfobacterales bacterium]|nr:MAG: lytic transglycosylase [Desulfobacterales bacterium]
MDHRPFALRMGLMAIIWFVLGCPAGGLADIYKFIDADGVVHFTNAPSSEGYVLYLREKPWWIKKKIRPAPKIYDPIIQKAATTYGVDQALIKAVIRVESDFNPNALSKKGARGLMQIMPENDRSLDIANAFDPSQNIMGGTRYLSRLLTRYDRKLALALAAYNAGPTAVDLYGRIPPYEETQNYVKKVMACYEQYKRS